MLNATFDDPDLTTFARLEELGLVVVGQRLTAARAVLECRLAEEDPWCRACGARSTSRGSITRSLAHGAVRSQAHDVAGADSPLPV